MANSYLTEKYARYEHTTSRLPSAREFFDTLDEQFSFFLHQTEPTTVHMWNAILERRPLSEVIPELLPQLDFSSEDELSADEFRALMLEMQSCISDITENPAYYYMARYKGNSPLALAAQEVFHNEDVTTAMALTFERFFCWLIELHFIEPKNPARERALKQADLWRNVSTYITLTALTLKDHPEKQQVIYTSLFALFECDLDPEIIEAIFVKMNQPEIYNENFFSTVQSLFQEHCPACWLIADTEEKIRVALLGKNDKIEFAKITTKSDFYFTDTEECDIAAYATDVFPPLAQMVTPDRYRDLVAGKDCSVFRADGSKVFWGDLLIEDTRALQGKYFVLRGNTSIGEDVPACAILTQSPWPATEPDAIPNRERLSERPKDITALDPNYVRLMSVCRIENGVITPNNNRYTCVIGSRTIKELEAKLRGEPPTAARANES